MDAATEAPVRMIAGNAPLYAVQQRAIDTLEAQKNDIKKALEEFQSKAKAQTSDLSSRQEQARDRQLKIIAMDVAEFLRVRKGWEVGRPMEFQGTVVAFTDEGIKVNKNWDSYTPPSIDGEYVPSLRRDSWYVNVHLGLHGRSREIGSIMLWQDDLVVYWEAYEECQHSDLPIGSHYPTRLQIGNALRGSGARIDEKGFAMDWTWARYRGSNRYGVAGQNSLVKSLAYSCRDLNSLRAMAFHQNRYGKLVKSMTSRGYLESHEYQEIRDGNENLTELVAHFTFKMIEKGDDDVQEDN